MKIMHLEASNGWGGQEIRILTEAIWMRQKGHEILFGVEKGGVLVQKAREEGFSVYEFSFAKKYWLRTFLSLIRVLRQEQIDIVNTHSSLDAWIGGFAGRWAGKKILRTRHLSTPIRKWPNSPLLYKWLADVVVTTCNEAALMIKKQAKLPERRCLSIPTGICPNKVQQDPLEKAFWRKKFGISKEDYTVGTTCFMRSWKGVEDLLQAAFFLREEKIKFILVGGGNFAYYEKKASLMGLKKTVFFTGHVDPPFSVMALFDVFALLSRKNEGVSQAVLQAAFLEKPLITTPVGGLPEICRHQKTGIEVPIACPEAVVDAILTLRRKKAQAKEFASAAKRLVEEKFTESCMGRSMQQVYQMLEGNR